MSQGNISNINKVRCNAVQDALCLEIKCMDDMIGMSILVDGGATNTACHPATNTACFLET